MKSLKTRVLQNLNFFKTLKGIFNQDFNQEND